MIKYIGIVLGLVVVLGGVLFVSARYADAPAMPDNEERSMSTTTQNPRAIMTTNYGVIELELFADKAPKTVENFVTLARDGFYDGTMFHRVMSDFMIQGGDPNTRLEPENWQIHGTGGPDYMFEDEINDVLLVRGVLAMANRGPNTNGSQFFIVTAEATPWLDGKHTAFGRVTSGMDVVDAIEAVKVNEAAHPLEDVVVENIEIR